MADTSEVNVFSLDPNGFKTHWKLVSGTPAEEVTRMMNNQKVLSGWLKETGYKPDDMGRGGNTLPPTVVAPQTAPQAAPQGVATWIYPADNSPPSCSLHGVGTWKPPGTSRTTGKPYAGFWKCQTNGCKPAGER